VRLQHRLSFPSRGFAVLNTFRRCHRTQCQPVPVDTELVAEQSSVEFEFSIYAVRRSCWGKRYSAPPELASATVVVSHPVGGDHLDIATTAGIVVARHKLAADGLGATVRDGGHSVALGVAPSGFCAPRLQCRRATSRSGVEPATCPVNHLATNISRHIRGQIHRRRVLSTSLTTSVDGEHHDRAGTGCCSHSELQYGR
jgi:hypothetical protein